MTWDPGDSNKRRNYHHGNLREALIEAALRLIGEKGPGGFTVAEAARVLRPGGRLLLSSLASHQHKAVVDAYGHVNLGFSHRDLRRFVEKAGLALQSAETVTREKRPPHFEVVSLMARKA